MAWLRHPWAKNGLKIGRTDLPEGLACHAPLQCGRFLQGGDGSFQVFWRTDLEVDWERTQNYCVGLLVLYLSRIENRANFFVCRHILATKHRMQSPHRDKEDFLDVGLAQNTTFSGWAHFWSADSPDRDILRKCIWEGQLTNLMKGNFFVLFKVARLDFFGGIPPKFEH